MPELIEPIGHGDIVRGLVRSARQEQLPHALLFEGSEGIGKFRTALWLAATLLCESGGEAPCLSCGSCLRIKSDSHADLFVIDHRAENQNAISIHFIASRDTRPKDGYQGPPVEEFLTLRSAEGRGKFIIVREAEAMLEDAQNAFLKMLEEPRPGVHLLLETSSKSSLLATVRSRVVPVLFGALSREQCQEVLFREGPWKRSDPGEAQLVSDLVRLSDGSPGLALRLKSRSAPAIQALLGEVFLGKRSAGAASAELFDLKGTFPGKTPAAQRRTRARIILDLGLELLVDIERAGAGVDPNSLAHGHLAGPIASAPRYQRTPLRRDIAREWLAAREDIGLNLSPEGLVDRALLAVTHP